MARVECEVEYEDLEGEYTDVPGVVVTCLRCDHCEESFGQTERSIRRCLLLMRENCPHGENNFYVEEET